MLLSFNSSIYFTFISFDSNFNCVKVQISVLVPLHTLSAFQICFRFEKINYPQFCLCVIMAVSVLSINVVTVLFISLAVLLKNCFTRENTCLCELIGCACEESVGLYRQISTVKHSQSLIAVNYNSDKSNSTIVHVRMWCDFVCDAVDLFNSMFSIHTLILATFYSHYIYLWYISKCRFVSVDIGDVYWNSG